MSARGGSPLEPVSGDAVVLVNELIRLAVVQRASDIHLEPKHDMMHVRLRIDGALVDVQPIAIAVAPNVVSRVKVLAKMDISERRTPQGGRFLVRIGGPGRVSVSRFVYGHGRWAHAAGERRDS